MTTSTDTADTPELAEFRGQVRAWIDENKPARPDFVLPQSFLEVETKQQFEYLREWQHALYSAGYVGFDVPKEYGGQGVDKARQAIVTQEMSRAEAPFLVNTIALNWAGPTIMTFGSDEQKKKYLPGILSADEIWCQGFSEPSAGSDLASLQTRAVKQDDGSYKVTGHKVWTTVAHFAKWMILLARTDTEANKYAGLSYFLFPMDSDGVTIQPLVKMTREGGFNQVIFDESPMPADALLGKEGQGWNVAITTLLFERGAAETSARDRADGFARQLDKLVGLAKKVKRDGRPALEDPLIRDRIAQLWIDVEAIRAAASRVGVSGLVAAHPLGLRMANKLIFSEWMQRLAEVACDCLGPDGMLWMGDANAIDDAEWSRAYLNSYGFTIGGGTSEIQRNIVGERALGMAKSK